MRFAASPNVVRGFSCHLFRWCLQELCARSHRIPLRWASGNPRKNLVSLFAENPRVCKPIQCLTHNWSMLTNCFGFSAFSVHLHLQTCSAQADRWTTLTPHIQGTLQDRTATVITPVTTLTTLVKQVRASHYHCVFVCIWSAFGSVLFPPFPPDALCHRHFVVLNLSPLPFIFVSFLQCPDIASIYWSKIQKNKTKQRPGRIVYWSLLYTFSSRQITYHVENWENWVRETKKD